MTQASSAGLLAAIDIGSNSFRLEIGPRHSQEKYRRVDYLTETVRLGAGLDAEGMLSEEAMQRGLGCLARFASRIEGFPSENVRAVATQTLREAKNRDQFLARATAVLGHPIEVISGREEARLIYQGVARLQPSNKQRLVIDIGGRSTEMIIGRGRTPLVAESFQVGSVSLSMRYFADGCFTEEAFRAAQVAAGAELEEAIEAFSPPHWREALGSSGTVSAVSTLLESSGITDGRITPEGLRWCISRCLQAGHVDKLDLPKLKPERRAVIGGGLSLLYTLTSQFGIGELLPAKGALRQGVIFELADRLDARRGTQLHDAREQSVASLQRRFHVDLAQAGRVEQVALEFYRGAHSGPLTEPARELVWACALHEVGMMVSHHDHHRHSAYLVEHVDAPGFSENQQRRVADLVLGQRGGLLKVEAQLSQLEFAWQLLCLRLAIIVCHARANVGHARPRLQRKGHEAALIFTPAWAKSHPRTLHLLLEEAAAWKSSSSPLRLTVDQPGPAST